MKNNKNLLKSNKDPFKLFDKWFSLAKKKEINDPNASALATADKLGVPSVRMVLLKDYNDDGFVFYTNFNSDKSKAIKKDPKISMCFHWKSLLRQVRIVGLASKVSDKEADEYFNSRSYGSGIGAWASEQSAILMNRQDLLNSIEKYKKKFPNKNELPRPKHWSGWRLKPEEIEFWLDGENRIHERLKYIKNKNIWERVLLSP